MLLLGVSGIALGWWTFMRRNFFPNIEFNVI